MRFAFYGSTSTSDCQDPVTSWAWQRAVADALVKDSGQVVVEFFDEARSRRWSWIDRLAGAALLAPSEDPHRDFDAVVVGEFERAFYGDRFGMWLPSLTRSVYGSGCRRRMVRSRWTVRCIKRCWCCWVRRRSVR